MAKYITQAGYELLASLIEWPACGAGHYCCDEPAEPPLHDHFLMPEECPSCLRAVAAPLRVQESDDDQA